MRTLNFLYHQTQCNHQEDNGENQGEGYWKELRWTGKNERMKLKIMTTLWVEDDNWPCFSPTDLEGRGIHTSCLLACILPAD